MNDIAKILRKDDIELIRGALDARVIAITDLLDRKVWDQTKYDNKYNHIQKIHGKLELLKDLKQ